MLVGRLLRLPVLQPVVAHLLLHRHSSATHVAYIDADCITIPVHACSHPHSYAAVPTHRAVGARQQQPLAALKEGQRPERHQPGAQQLQGLRLGHVPHLQHACSSSRGAGSACCLLSAIVSICILKHPAAAAFLWAAFCAAWDSSSPCWQLVSHTISAANSLKAPPAPLQAT